MSQLKCNHCDIARHFQFNSLVKKTQKQLLKKALNIIILLICKVSLLINPHCSFYATMIITNLTIFY